MPSRRTVTILAVGSLATLLVLGLGNYAHVFVLILPIQAVASIVARALLRTAFIEARRRGRNWRVHRDHRDGPVGGRVRPEADRAMGAGPRSRWVPPELSTSWFALGTRYLGEVSELPRLLHERVIDEVAIYSLLARSSEIERLCSECVEEGKTVRIPTAMQDHPFTGGLIEDLDGSPVVSVVSGPNPSAQLVAKRMMDIVGATLGLIVLTLLFVVIAIAIAMTEGRPVVFRQIRVGPAHGRPSTS